MVTYEERQLMAIYNTGTRQGLLEELTRYYRRSVHR